MRTRVSKFYLPQTGQTTSYADGDDGHFQAGNPRATRFVDNGNGTITDRATGLTWVKDMTDCGAAFYTGGVLVTFSWSQAVAACVALEYAGLTDWRLPNVLEQVSLVSMGANPNVPAGIVSPADAIYWTSTTDAANTAYAHRVTADRLNVSIDAKTTNTFYGRPVRGGDDAALRVAPGYPADDTVTNGVVFGMTGVEYEGTRPKNIIITGKVVTIR